MGSACTGNEAMREQTLVDGFTFARIRGDGISGEPGGFFHRDTRYLATLDVAFDGTPFDVIDARRSAPSKRTATLVQQPHRSARNTDQSTRRALVLTREQRVVEGAYTERLTLANHSASPRAGTLDVEFGVDFADLFEVRGLADSGGRDVDVTVEDTAVGYEYRFDDADGRAVAFDSTVTFDRVPTTLRPGRAEFQVDLASQDQTTIVVDVSADVSNVLEPTRGTLSEVREANSPRAESIGDRSPLVDESLVERIETGTPDYDQTFHQAARDLNALSAGTAYGPVCVAGVPWYATVFGRDALLSATLALPVAPELAAGTLRYLAAWQGTTDDGDREEAPGKVFHELRHGELARQGAIPHSPYYGSIDATPLWVVLLHEHYEWTGDRSLVSGLESSLDGALRWIVEAIDRIGDDPFLYYCCSDESGLVHKAWRDAADSVQFQDGRPADSPLASVEVQGYAYDALSRGATLLQTVLDRDDLASRCVARAEAIRRRFHDAFWLPDRRFYAAARTAQGDRADSLTSNVGHCLWTGIVDDEYEEPVCNRLLSSELFSGWGVRTMSTADAGYNPVSYHVGSVWPHDTALLSLGLARYGHFDAAETVATDLLDASTQFEDHRLPELFCGFDDTRPPVVYPTACCPQSWAAAAPFGLLRAVFGLEPGDGSLTVRNDPASVDRRAINPIEAAWRESPESDPDEN